MLKEVLYHEYVTILIFYPSSNGFKIHKVETEIVKMTVLVGDQQSKWQNKQIKIDRYRSLDSVHVCTQQLQHT